DRSGNDSIASRDEIDARPEISAQLMSPIEREHHYASLVRVGVLHRRGPAVRIADVVIDAVADAGYAGRIQIIAHQRAVAVESFDRSSRATIHRRRLSLRPGVTKKRKRRLLRGNQQLAGRYARRQGNGRLLRPDGHLKERTVVSVVSLPAGCRAAGILLARRLGRRTPGKTCEQRAYVPGIPPALAKPARQAVAAPRHDPTHLTSLPVRPAASPSVDASISKLHCSAPDAPHLTEKRRVPSRPVSQTLPTGPTMPRCSPSSA